MTEHKRKHSKLFRCKVCNEGFYTEDKLDKHVAKVIIILKLFLFQGGGSYRKNAPLNSEKCFTGLKILVKDTHYLQEKWSQQGFC